MVGDSILISSIMASIFFMRSGVEDIVVVCMSEDVGRLACSWKGNKGLHEWFVCVMV